MKKIFLFFNLTVFYLLLTINFSYSSVTNKIIANVDTIDLADNNTEQNFGLTDEMTNIEKCKALRKEYTKWSGQTAHKDKKKKKRAKEMVNIIANLRKKYDC